MQQLLMLCLDRLALDDTLLKQAAATCVSTAAAAADHAASQK
jgi:hypothetical protein